METQPAYQEGEPEYPNNPTYTYRPIKLFLGAAVIVVPLCLVAGIYLNRSKSHQRLENPSRIEAIAQDSEIDPIIIQCGRETFTIRTKVRNGVIKQTTEFSKK